MDARRGGSEERHDYRLFDHNTFEAFNRTLAAATFQSNGRQRFATNQWVELFGNSAADPLRTHWMELCHPEDIGLLEEAVERALTTGITVRAEFRRRPDRHVTDSPIRWIGISVTPLEPRGPTAGWFASAADITDRLRDVAERRAALAALEEAHHRLANLVENLDIGVLFVAADQRVVASNSPFCELFHLDEPHGHLVGAPEDGLIGQVQELAKEPERYSEQMASIRRHPDRPHRTDVDLLDDRFLEQVYIPIEGQGHLWLYRDRTNERQLAIRQAQLLAQEQLQNDRLRELDVIRREFVSVLTHEFRTPLTSIIGYTEVLELDQDEPDADSIRGYAEIIRRNGDRLLRLVDDLLTLDRLESRLLPVVASEVNVADVVSMAVRTLRAVARGKGISLQSKVREGPTLSGDAERLGQLVDNLIANALKFTEPGGRVRVTAKPVAQGWSITVSDTGIGIPSDEIDDLFERFYRASNAKQLAVSGSGLGLAIVRAIVDQHHGSISVQSEEAFGTTFQVLLRDLIPTGR